MYIHIQEAKNGYTITKVPEPWDYKKAGGYAPGEAPDPFIDQRNEVFIASDAEEVLGIIRQLLEGR